MFRFQNPYAADVTYLLEAIAEAADGAMEGGGIFAFASADGASLLLRDETFKTFVKRSHFELFIGLDAITNEDAITAWSKAMNVHPKILVKAFLSPAHGATFHPKLCWFRHSGSTRLIVGSGNLTRGGLKGNWEAFTITDLKGSAQSDFYTAISQWAKANAASLRNLNDPDVLERAKKNVWTPAAGNGAPGASQPDEKVVAVAVAARTALIAEIPNNNVRWKQANFDIKTFREFFQLNPGTHQSVTLRHVQSDGSLAPTEVRPSVAVKSKNYRIELGAAGGLQYPSGGRPIGVFIRVATREFLYVIVMPQDTGHELLTAHLRKAFQGPANRMKRITTTTDILEDVWPNAPFWTSEKSP